MHTKTTLTITTNTFFLNQDSRQFLELLKLIHNLQKMLEDNQAKVSYVYLKWLKLEEHLKRTANSKSLFATDVKFYLTIIFIEGIKLTSIEKKY